MNATSRRSTFGIGEQPLDPGDDARGNAVGRIVRRRNFDARNQLARRRIDRDDVGKRAPDVDAHAKFCSLPVGGEDVADHAQHRPAAAVGSGRRARCRSRRSDSRLGPMCGRYDDEAARPSSAVAVERLRRSKPRRA